MVPCCTRKGALKIFSYNTMMSALKWSLSVLALTALLSSQIMFCSANRAHIFSEYVDPWPIDDDHVAPTRPPIDLAAGPGPSPAIPGDGSGPSPAQGLMPVDGPTMDPLIDGSEPSPARKAPPAPKEEITAAPIPAMKNGTNESDISMNCGGWGGPGCGGGVGCGGPPCVPPPPKNPYYCQPAACTAYPGCGVGAGAGPGFTIYMDDHFVAAVSSSGNEHKP